MAQLPLPEMSPWKPRSLTIPPNSMHAWLRLAIWELWMGTLLCVVVGLGVFLISTAPDRVLAVADLTNCYGPPPVPIPCERIVYRGGVLNAAFSALCGLVMIGVAFWLLWELWNAVEPKPITDDFLRLLNDSFGRDWRNPLKWPWARLLWAYGFAIVGAVVTASVGMIFWTLVASSDSGRAPTVDVETSQSFRLGR